jgi:TatD DNase family protein
MIDSHCHLADEAFAADLDPVVARARAAGVERALCILAADAPAELDQARRVKDAWPAVRFAASIHPHAAGGYAGRVDEAVRLTRAAANATEAAAIGEIGLDYHYDFAPRDVQRDVFGAQVALAVELNRPVVIHSREAMADTLAVLRDAGQRRVQVVMHCFTGSADDARRALELGCHISLAGVLTFPKAEALRDVARFIPADRLLVETDAPFLAPVPHRGKRNEPAWVIETIARLAEVRSVPIAQLAGELAQNFERLVGAGA